MPHTTSKHKLASLTELPIEKGTLSFIQDLKKYNHERPYRWAGALAESQEHKRTNIVLESKDNIPFRDIRSLIDCPEKLSLQNDGFQILRRAPGQDDPVLGAEDDVLGRYLSGLAVDIKALLNAETLYCVNFVVSPLLTQEGYLSCCLCRLMTSHEQFRH